MFSIHGEKITKFPQQEILHPDTADCPDSLVWQEQNIGTKSYLIHLKYRVQFITTARQELCCIATIRTVTSQLDR
jgi:hypothetical protein